MTDEPSDDRHRIDYVDGLRALAVLAVLVAHVVSHSAAKGGSASRLFLEGAHGVDLFFVLSGFCLAYPTLAKVRSRGTSIFSITDFGAKRFVRIVPPFYLATIGLLLVAVASAAIRHRPLDGVPPARDIAASLLFLDGHVLLLNSSFWTLMVEFRWYFAFPLLLALWLKSPRGFLTLAAACVVLYHFTRARGLDLGTLPGFMLGIVAADLHVGTWLRSNVAHLICRFALPLACACAIGGVAVESNAWIPGFDHADIRTPYQPTILGWQLATFFFVVAAGTLGWLRALLASKAFVATGVASYAIYLVHEPVVAAVYAYAKGIGSAVLAFVAALAVGFAFWRMAERPFTTGRLRRPLLDWLTPMLTRACVFFGVPHAIEVGSTEHVPMPPAPSPRPLVPVND